MRTLSNTMSLKFLAIENMPPHFSARVYFGQTAGRIMISLGMEYGLQRYASAQATLC